MFHTLPLHIVNKSLLLVAGLVFEDDRWCAARNSGRSGGTNVSCFWELSSNAHTHTCFMGTFHWHNDL